MSSATTPERLNLGCNVDQPAGWHNVDLNPGVEPDEVVDLSDTPWPWPDGSVSEIRLFHVLEHLQDPVPALEECARILVSGGEVHVRVPVGLDADADPDHEHRWMWQTPEMLCGARNWDADCGLSVSRRDVSIAGVVPGPLGDFYNRLLRRALNRYGPGRWSFSMPATTGVFDIWFAKGGDA